MKKEKLLICDHDLSYVEFLTDYLNRQPEFDFQAVPFTRKEALLDFLSRERCQYLLLDQGLGDGKEEAFEGMLVKALLEESTPGGDGICRYQSCPDLCRQILKEFRPALGGEQTDRVRPEEDGQGGETLSESPRHGRILGVYSPVNRCGKTIFAVTLGMVLAERERVLYWNLENYHGLETLCQTRGRQDLSDLLYRVRMGDSCDARELFGDAVTDWGGLDCLNPAAASFDLNEVSVREWAALLNMAIDEAGYKTIVLDIGAQIRDVFSVLMQCSRIYMPILGDRMSQAKVRQFEQNLEILHAVTVQERICKVAVPRLRSDSELSGFPTQLLRGKIGSYVRQITMEDE